MNLMNSHNNINEVKTFFSTPIWTSLISHYKELNADLMEYIENLKENDPEGLKRSNNIGWHSKDFNLQDSVPKKFINAISKNINKAITDMGWDLKKNHIKITSMWSIININQASNHRHIHSNNYISAAYYLKAPNNCGDIVFYDPRESRIVRKPKIQFKNELNAETVNISPKEGALVLFPSFLHHSVNPNLSNSERVVVSFNIDLI